MSSTAVIRKYSTKEVVMPENISKKYMEYCRFTRMKMSDSLKVLIMESLPRLHDSEDLDLIIVKTRSINLYKEMDKDSEVQYVRHYVRLPADVIQQINTYCKFFKLRNKRCHFLYFLIEKKLLATIEEVLGNEKDNHGCGDVL